MTDYFTVAGLANFTGLSQRYWHERTRLREIEHYKFGNKIRIPKDEAIKFIESHKVKSNGKKTA